MVESERLILRSFREADREPFARINADPRVHDWLGGPIDRAASDASIDQANAHIAEHGYGLWAAEHRPSGQLVGMIGLKPALAALPISPAIEVGWHLGFDDWGKGLATEGARAALDWAFGNLGAGEIFATTAARNLRSLGVMRRLGMTAQPSCAFDHPLLPDGHPLRRHLVHAIANPIGRAARTAARPQSRPAYRSS